MLTVILAEKESQALDYAEALGNFTTRKKVHIIKRTPFLLGEVHIAFQKIIGI